jgi:TetR/AcrR family transcriptional regulator
MPSHPPPRHSASSRERLLDAAKRLFAAQGYEQSATSAIAREAGTSESQLMRYFGGKVGLLEALFEDAWTHLNARVIKAIASATSTRQALLDGIAAIVSALARDSDLATLLLFEGRRVRGDEPRIRLSRGFVHFADTIRDLVQKGQAAQQLDPSLDSNAMTSALLGATEGLIRDRLLARSGTTRGFRERDIERTLEGMLDGFSGGSRRTTRNGGSGRRRGPQRAS